MWFRKLAPAEKCAWQYLLLNCDNAGVWDCDFEAAGFWIGEEIDWVDFLEKVNKNIQIIGENKWWLVDFCTFQYGNLDEDTNNKAHISHINLLKRHDLWATYKGHPCPIQGAKEKEEVKEKATVKAKEKDTGLYMEILEMFVEKNGPFDDYGKEGKNIYTLIKKAKTLKQEPHDFLLLNIIPQFWELKQTDDKFWGKQPFTPSALSPLFSRVAEYFKKNVQRDSQEEAAFAELERAGI